MGAEPVACTVSTATTHGVLATAAATCGSAENTSPSATTKITKSLAVSVAAISASKSYFTHENFSAHDVNVASGAMVQPALAQLSSSEERHTLSTRKRHAHELDPHLQRDVTKHAPVPNRPACVIAHGFPAPLEKAPDFVSVGSVSVHHLRRVDNAHEARI